MKKASRTTIDFFDLFELMGTPHLSRAEKKQLLGELSAMTLERFFYEQALGMENESAISQLRKLAADQSDPNEMLALLQQGNPEFMKQFVKHTQEAKKAYLLEYYNQMILALMEKRSFIARQHKDHHSIQEFDKRISIYKNAERAAQENSWQQIIELMKALPSSK